MKTYISTGNWSQEQA